MIGKVQVGNATTEAGGFEIRPTPKLSIKITLIP